MTALQVFEDICHASHFISSLLTPVLSSLLKDKHIKRGVSGTRSFSGLINLAIYHLQGNVFFSLWIVQITSVLQPFIPDSIHHPELPLTPGVLEYNQDEIIALTFIVHNILDVGCKS